MSDYQAPLRDMQFILGEVFEANHLWSSWPALEGVIDPETAQAVLEEAARVTGKTIAPLNLSSDAEGCRWQSGAVKTPEGFRDAYQVYAEGGWVGIAGEPRFGGMGMPKALSAQIEEMVNSASLSFGLYPMLTAGACLAINAHGDDFLRETFLPKLYEGRWSGTMCLTEAHAGTDLGLIRTRAEPQEDGTYRITGSKIFITGGEHDLTENIIHLVLAKLPDAPAGSRGISLFLVPKLWLDEQGNPQEANAVTCGSIEHKMGIKASATCVMNFDGARGYLLGSLNKGLAAMFTMMNYERLGVGIQGLATGERSYQVALAYARERLQSRAPGGPTQPEKAADPIIVHPDVRRMLLTMKALNEGGRAFSSYVAMQLDTAKYTTDAAQRTRAEGLVALLTPVAKAFMTDCGFETTVHGQQILGGHGYIHESGQEQLVRDCRITQIYEGTNGIQALDLLGRKVVASRGEYYALFSEEVHAFIARQGEDAADYVVPLQEAIDNLDQVTEWLLARGARVEEVGAASVEYLHVFGYTAYAYMWVRMALMAAGQQQDGFYRAKQATARFFLARILPRIHSLTATLKAGSDPLYLLAEEDF